MRTRYSALRPVRASSALRSTAGGGGKLAASGPRENREKKLLSIGVAQTDPGGGFIKTSHKRHERLGRISKQGNRHLPGCLSPARWLSSDMRPSTARSGSV